MPFDGYGLQKELDDLCITPFLQPYPAGDLVAFLLQEH